MEGRPGSGKTTLLKHWAIRWAEYMEQSERDEPCDGNQGTFTLSDIDLLVYINRDHEGSCLEETIQNAMKGPPREKKEAAQLWKEHPDKVFLFIDALDEFNNKKVISEVFRLASDQSTNLLVSCRDGHQYLNDQMNNFTRHLKVAGFTQTGTKKLIGKYMNVLCEEKANDLCSHINEAQHSHIYTSPMNCVFVCQLYSEERLSSEELVNLTLPKLYMRVEDLLLEREYKKLTEKKRLEGGKEENEEMKEKIYKMALRSLVVGEIGYTANQLEEFGIDVNSPAMVLLQKYNHTSTIGEVEVYHWPHRTVREYHAAKAIKSREMIYFIAAKQELLGITHFLLPMLAETDLESATHLLNASLFLQAEHLPNCKESLFSRVFGLNHCYKIQGLKREIHRLELDELLDGELTLHNALDIEAIQKCISNSNWLWDNIFEVIILCSCVEYIESQDILFHFMKTVLFPFLPIKVPFEKAKRSLLFFKEFYVSLRAFLDSQESNNDDDDDDDNGQCLGEYDLTDALDKVREIVYQAKKASDRIEDDLSEIEDAPDDSSEGEDAPDDSSEGEEAPDDSYDLEDAPDDSCEIEDAPNDSSEREEALDDSSEREDAPDDSSEREEAPDDSSEREEAPDDSSEREEAPDDSSEKEDAPDDSYEIEDALDDSSEREEAPDDSSEREEAPDDSSEKEDAPDDSYEIEDARDEIYFKNRFHEVKYLFHQLGKWFLLSKITFYLHLIKVRRRPYVFGMTLPNTTEVMELLPDTDKCISTGGLNLLFDFPLEIEFDDFTRNNLNNLAKAVGHIKYLILGMFQEENTDGKVPVETILELNEIFKPVKGVILPPIANAVAGRPESAKKILKHMGVNISTQNIIAQNL